MTRAEWQTVFDAQPPDLTLKELSRNVGRSYRLTATWVHRLGYRAAPGRKTAWTGDRRRGMWLVPWDEVDWEKPDIDIARDFRVSREIVRRRRKEFGR